MSHLVVASHRVAALTAARVLGSWGGTVPARHRMLVGADDLDTLTHELGMKMVPAHLVYSALHHVAEVLDRAEVVLRTKGETDAIFWKRAETLSTTRELGLPWAWQESAAELRGHLLEMMGIQPNAVGVLHLALRNAIWCLRRAERVAGKTSKGFAGSLVKLTGSQGPGAGWAVPRGLPSPDFAEDARPWPELPPAADAPILTPPPCFDCREELLRQLRVKGAPL